MVKLCKKLVIATHNLGKIAEIKRFMFDKGLDKFAIYSAKDFNLTSPCEDGKDFYENALIKAKFVSEQTKLPALADDSGFCVESLGGFPGFHSAELAEKLSKVAGRNYHAAQNYIIEQLASKTDRSAYFLCCLCFYLPDGEHYYFEGRVDGTVAKHIIGDKGFGYDPLFIPKGSEQSFAQMSLEQKSQYPTHRNLALRKFINFLAGKL